LLKPEAVGHGQVVGEIIERVLREGFVLARLKTRIATRELLEAHYGEHVGRPYFETLVSDMAGKVVIAIELFGGPDAVQRLRTLIGPFREAERVEGTIRARYMRPGDPNNRNFVHASDSNENAKRELALWFSED